MEVVQMARTELLYAERSRVRVTPSTLMNEDNKINFAYIAGKNHGRVDITPEQLNQVMKILYG